jgi:hypothetical protein
VDETSYFNLDDGGDGGLADASGPCRKRSRMLDAVLPPRHEAFSLRRDERWR